MSMTEIRRYIREANIPGMLEADYRLCYDELVEFRWLAETDPFNALFLLFDYGRAQGYRMAQTEVRLCD